MRLIRRKVVKQIQDDAEPKGLQYRCTLQGIQIFYDEVKSKLRKGHHVAIEKTPFKHLFKALHDDVIVREQKKGQLFDDLILCYDRKAKTFKFGSEFYMPTRLDVKLIFGIEDGTEDVGKISHYGRGASKLRARRFANDDRITIKKVKDKVKELVGNEDQESIDDTVKLLCVIILHNVLFPNTGASISWGFLYYVDDFDRLNSFDWSKHVLDELMNGLHADWSIPKQVNGCILLLPYWLCEHSYKIQDMYKNGEEMEPIEKGGQGISLKGIPRLTKWKLKNLQKLIDKSVLYKMDKKLFNNNELIPTIAEEQLIKSLSVKPRAKNIVMEHDLGLEQPPANDETSMDLVKRVQKLKESSGDGVEEGTGVESGYNSCEAAQVEKDIENYEEPEDNNSQGISNAEAESAHDELMIRGFDTPEIPMSENVGEPQNNSKGKSFAEARNVRVQYKLKKKKELGKTVTVLGKRKKRLTKENFKEKTSKGLKKDVERKRLEEEISRLKGIVDSLKQEHVNLIGKQETMAAEHFEMEIALDEEVSKKTELLCELENEKMARKALLNEHFEMEIALDEEVSKKTELLLCELEKEKLARKELLNELALAKIKNDQHEDKAKENESLVHNLQTYIQNIVQGSGSQNFGQESIQQQEVDKTMIESLGERVARLEKAMHEKDTTVSNLKAMDQDYEGATYYLW